MSSQLRLMLERVISVSRLSNALELPLDRKLGDLSRYTYVYADALPLRMERRISDQPASNALYLSLSQPLGTLAPVMYVTSNALPLPLSVPVSEQPVSSALPLGMTRKLGTLVGQYVPPVEPPIDPEEPVDPKPPLEYAPPMSHLASCVGSVIHAAHNVSHCRYSRHDARQVAHDYAVRYLAVTNISQRYVMQQRGLIHIANARDTLTTRIFTLAKDARISYIPFIPIFNDARPFISSAVGYTRCVDVHSATVAYYRHCDTLPLQSVVNHATSAAHSQRGFDLSHCQRAKVQHAVSVPDRHYPIPEPDPTPPDYGVCKIRPPSSQLPLRMSRRRGGLLSSHLPLAMTCWHDDPPLPIPNLRTYIVHNVITATIGGITVDLLSFNIKTDMDSYCWQGNIDITAKDYAKIKHKLDVPRSSEPMINVTVNGFTFAFIAEEQSRSRKFAQHSHSLSGRSITARLGADYAQSQGGLIELESYVSQIVAQQLNGLPITLLDWGINDWLVPARAYSTVNKTPIAVISDIAAAGGGFVLSDPSQATLSVKPRWSVAAWQLASATPDVTVPIDVISDISDKKRTNPRYNTVFLTSASEGGEVYRQLQGRDAEAPTQDHALYTDRDAIVPAGTTILSDSGTHGDYTLKMLWSDKYNISLAKLGQIWQINDAEGAWRGVITGVSVDIDKDNDAPTVWQTATIDRYLDN